MATFFRKPDRRQRFLLPVDMRAWLPESDFVHLVRAITLWSGTWSPTIIR